MGGAGLWGLRIRPVQDAWTRQNNRMRRRGEGMNKLRLWLYRKNVYFSVLIG
jgi:hypothetical protein